MDSWLENCGRLPSLKLAVRTWKLMVGRLLSFWEGSFWGVICPNLEVECLPDGKKKTCQTKLVKAMVLVVCLFPLSDHSHQNRQSTPFLFGQNFPLMKFPCYAGPPWQAKAWRFHAGKWGVSLKKEDKVIDERRKAPFTSNCDSWWLRSSLGMWCMELKPWLVVKVRSS